MTHLYGPTDPEPETQLRCVCGRLNYDENYTTCRECGRALGI